MAAERVVQVRGRHRAIEPARHQEVADEAVGVEQHLGWEEHVVDADDALLVEHAIVHERASRAGA